MSERKARLRMRKRRGCTFETARRSRIENMKLRSAKYARKKFIKELEEKGLNKQALYVELICAQYGFGKALSEYAIEQYVLKGEFPSRYLLDGDLDAICRWIDKRTKVRVLPPKRQQKRKTQAQREARNKAFKRKQELDAILKRGEEKGRLEVAAIEALKNIRL